MQYNDPPMEGSHFPDVGWDANEPVSQALGVVLYLYSGWLSTGSMEESPISLKAN